MHTIIGNYDNYWVEEQFTWRIPDSRMTLTKLCQFKTGVKHKSEEFEIAKLKWRIEVYPSGYREDSKGSFKLYVQLVSMDSIPGKPKSIIVCRTIECIESFSKVTNICNYKKDESYGWRTGSLLLKEIVLNKYETLTFKITVKLLQINYEKNNNFRKNQPQKTPILNPILLQYDYRKQYGLKWTLSKGLIAIMKNANVAKKFESKMFYDMWCLQCVPNGLVRDTKSAGDFRIYLQLTGLPKCIRSINIQYTIYFTQIKNTKEIGTKVFSYKSTWIKTQSALLSFEEFKKFDELNVCATIEILNEYDQKGKDITMKEREIDWDRYANERNEKTITKTNKIRKLKYKSKQYDDIECMKENVETHSKQIISLNVTTHSIERKINKLFKNYNYNSEHEHDHENEDRKKEDSLSDYSQSFKSISNKSIIKRYGNEIRKKHIKKAYSRNETDIENINLRIDSMCTKMEKMELMAIKILQIENNENKNKQKQNKKQKEIYDWISNEIGLNQYFNCFIQNGFDDLDSIQCISEMQHLTDMGIQKTGHKIQILDAIKQLKLKKNYKLS